MCICTHLFFLQNTFTTSNLCKFLLKKKIIEIMSFIPVCCLSKNLFMLFDLDLTDVM